uniref:Uncharacterized protein n=1 Tax=Rousettus aegyptiacus TaxID=9407 RepID=A0A7J8H0H9_ROUAE|nr:hypothetical protein HJG63_011183 [Rousettus aegyptiacus]
MKFAWTCPLHGTRQTAARFCGNASYRLYKTSSGTQVSPMMGASTSRYLPPALSHVTSQQPLEGSGSRRVAAGPAPASASPGTRTGKCQDRGRSLPGAHVVAARTWGGIVRFGHQPRRGAPAQPFRNIDI